MTSADASPRRLAIGLALFEPQPLSTALSMAPGFAGIT